MFGSTGDRVMNKFSTRLSKLEHKKCRNKFVTVGDVSNEEVQKIKENNPGAMVFRIVNKTIGRRSDGTVGEL
jgi:hypothetical protein